MNDSDPYGTLSTPCIIRKNRHRALTSENGLLLEEKQLILLMSASPSNSHREKVDSLSINVFLSFYSELLPTPTVMLVLYTNKTRSEQ